jgi:hypothetical protein
VSQNGTIYYSNPAAPIDLDEAGSWLAVVPTVLTASLSISLEAKARPVDSWGHPKVPRLDVIEQQSVSDPSSEGSWIDVDSSENHTYSSWTGINIQGLHKSEDAVFQVKYNYMYLDCPKPSIDTPENTLDGLLASNIATFPPLIRTSANDESALHTFANISNAGSGLGGVATQEFLLRAVKTSNSTDRTPNMTTPYFTFEREPIGFLYGLSYKDREGNNKLPVSTPYLMYTCSPHVVTVDVRVECQANDCSVTRLRRAPGESASSLREACNTGEFYRMGCMTNATYAVFTFLRYFPTTMASLFSSPFNTPTTSPAFTRWLMGDDLPYNSGTNATVVTQATATDQERINRITTLLNTYFQGCAWGYQITRSGFFDIPEYPWTGSQESRSPDRWISASDAVFSHPVPVYRADVGWIISLLLITLVLLLLGIINVAYSFITIAPDLFYYASSLARENPYTNTPDGGTAMDGAKRSRLLRNMKVQIADVSPENQIGYVVVKSVESEEDFLTGRLRKARMYW